MIANERVISLKSKSLEYKSKNELAFSYNISLLVYRFVKRVFDILAGIFGTILLAPMYLFVKAANVINGDYAPVIYTQKRVGLNGEIFKFYKFRSMVPDADEELYRLMREDPEIAAEYEENKKLKNDPRITKVGKIIRRTSLDEFPQFLNILKGDMSLIGNRPYLPREIKDMGEYYNEIIKSKPGLTGLWQVSGRSDIRFIQRLKLESYYSNNYGFGIDIKIFFKTFRVVFKRQGAK